jgi:hypothetical protein
VRKLAFLALVFAVVCFVTARVGHSLLVDGVGLAVLLGAAFLYSRSRGYPGLEQGLRLTDEGVSVMAGDKTVSHVSWARLVVRWRRTSSSARRTRPVGTASFLTRSPRSC